MPYEPAPGLLEEALSTLGPLGLLGVGLALVHAWFLFRLRARWIREAVHRGGRDPIRSYWELHRAAVRRAASEDRDLRGAAAALGGLLLVWAAAGAWRLIGGSS